MDNNLYLCGLKIKYMKETKETKSELLYSWECPNVELLNEIYDGDRYHARVYYMNTNESRSDNFKSKRLYRFEDKNGDIDFVLFIKSHGISKTNKRYRSDKVGFRVRIRKTGIWVTYKNKVRSFMLNDSLFHTHSVEIGDVLRDAMYKELAWYRYLREEFIYFDKSLNYFINHKLYNKKSIIKNAYGFDWPLSNILYELDRSGNFFRASDFRKLQYYKPWIVNENKLDVDMVRDNWILFHDSLKVAKAIDKKVNLRWSKSRLEREHGKMSMELVNIIYQYDNSVLVNKACYLDFAKMSGYRLIGTAKELAIEGIEKHHCVISYKTNIDGGRAGIYSIGDWTLELGESSEGLYINQFRGYGNIKGSDVIRDEIQVHLDIFNKDFKSEVVSNNISEIWDIPF